MLSDAVQHAMSASPLEADIDEGGANVRFVPKADVAKLSGHSRKP
jgi:hypothetical protein